MTRTGRIGATAVVGFAAFAIQQFAGWPTTQLANKTETVVSVLIPALGAGLAARAASDSIGRLRRGWLALAIGLASATCGELLWAVYKFHGDKAPMPSAADFLYLVFPVGIVVALLLIPVGLQRQSRSRLVLDGVVVASSLLIVSWLTVMRPLYEEGALSPPALAVALAYPVSNVVSLTVAIVVLAHSEGTQRRALRLMALGLVGMALAEVGFAYLSAGGVDPDKVHLVGLGWTAGMFLVAAAAADGCRPGTGPPSRAEIPGWPSVLLPYAPLMLAGVVMAAQLPGHPGSRLVWVTGAVLLAAVLIRQFFSVGESRRIMTAVADEAMRDPLTGLGNRALFQDRLAHALQLRQSTGLSVGLLMLDLNDFKLVNDTMGHPSGDVLLNSVGERLSASVRPGDTVARLGGDEFAVLVEGQIQQWIPIAQRVAEGFDRPFEVEGHELSIRPSIGLAVADATEPEISAEELLKRADIAMYSAKREHGRGIYTFSADMRRAEPVEPRSAGPQAASGGAAVVQLLGELHRAIDKSELMLVYQPKFDAATGAIVGVEALLRWPHPQLGLLPPAEFLPLVRQHELMDATTELVLGRALEDAAHWRSLGVTTPVAVNLFAPSLRNLNLPNEISDQLSRHGLPGSAITVEITEDLLLDDLETATAVLNELRSRGIKVAIDDFGSGFSALSYLSELPVDEVKLDHGFIAPVMVAERPAIVVSAVIDLAHRLGMTIVAEGVENAETAEKLRQLNCDVLQGYYLSSPLTSEELADLLVARASDEP